MSTVSMLIDNAERFCEARALAEQQARRASQESRTVPCRPVRGTVDKKGVTRYGAASDPFPS